MKKTILGLIVMLLLCASFVAADGDLEMTLTSSSLSGNPSDSVTFELTLTNGGATTINTIGITSTSLTSGVNTITAPTIASVTGLANGTSTTQTYSITIPSTPAGTYSGTITATDVDNVANTDTLPYEVVVNSQDAFSLSPTTLNFEEIAGRSGNEDFTITNTGSTTLTLFTINLTSADAEDEAGKIEDEDGDEITFTYSGTPTTLAPGASATVSVQAEISEDIDFGEDYTGTFTVSATGIGSVSNTMATDITVLADICEEGKQGNSFDINIENPDSGDEYNPGETIQIEVEIENTDNEELEIKVEAILYNTNEGKSEETVKVEEFDLNDDETETVEFELEIPSDLDEDDTYYLYIKVYESGNEDDNCDYERVRIDIERAEHDVLIKDAEISPNSGLTCGDGFTMTVEVENAGTEEEDDVYIELYDSDLDILVYSDEFDLGDYNDKDNDYRFVYTFNVPETLQAGSYYVEAKVYFDDTSVSELVLVTVAACDTDGSDSGSTDDGDNLRITLDSNIEAMQGSTLTIPLVIENEGSSDVSLDIEVSEVTWADLDGVEYLKTLGPGETTHAYIYLELHDGVYGEHDLVVTINDEQKIVSLDFGDEPIETEGFDFGDLNWLWIVIDIVLILVALALLVSLAMKK